MATNLTPPVTLGPRRSLFPTRLLFFSLFLRSIQRTTDLWLSSSRRSSSFSSFLGRCIYIYIYMMRTGQCFFPGPTSPFFTDGPAVLPGHFHRQPLRNLAVVKPEALDYSPPAYGVFAGGFTTTPFASPAICQCMLAPFTISCLIKFRISFLRTNREFCSCASGKISDRNGGETFARQAFTSKHFRFYDRNGSQSYLCPPYPLTKLFIYVGVPPFSQTFVFLFFFIFLGQLNQSNRTQ